MSEFDEMIKRNRAISQAAFGPTGEHDHVWGAVQYAHFTGNPHRKCKVTGCSWVTLDLEDEDEA